ncbi:CLUMA_CG000296, isoform A [Clunio marinus]|uniref:CLUMA_CG000296, isoform A n=1 Tax=Clunio marinus TaxID=568069 RepID=A0A1J1HJP5_9DIPT|nr:CLUMA_CG000296, isoform A [Clunio marinus]
MSHDKIYKPCRDLFTSHAQLAQHIRLNVGIAVNLQLYLHVLKFLYGLLINLQGLFFLWISIVNNSFMVPSNEKLCFMIHR